MIESEKELRCHERQQFESLQKSGQGSGNAPGNGGTGFDPGAMKLKECLKNWKPLSEAKPSTKPYVQSADLEHLSGRSGLDRQPPTQGSALEPAAPERLRGPADLRRPGRPGAGKASIHYRRQPQPGRRIAQKIVAAGGATHCRGAALSSDRAGLRYDPNNRQHVPGIGNKRNRKHIAPALIPGRTSLGL